MPPTRRRCSCTVPRARLIHGARRYEEKKRKTINRSSTMTFANAADASRVATPDDVSVSLYLGPRLPSAFPCLNGPTPAQDKLFPPPVHHALCSEAEPPNDHLQQQCVDFLRCARGALVVLGLFFRGSAARAGMHGYILAYPSVTATPVTQTGTAAVHTQSTTTTRPAYQKYHNFNTLPAGSGLAPKTHQASPDRTDRHFRTAHRTIYPCTHAPHPAIGLWVRLPESTGHAWDESSADGTYSL